MITENVVISKSYSWIDLERPMRVDFDFIKSEFQISPLLIQDLIKSDHLPKYEQTQEGHFILLRSWNPGAQEEEIAIEGLTNQVALFISKERLITIHNLELVFLRKFVDSTSRSIFPENMQILAHQILKNIIQTYEEPLSKLQDYYEGFEHEVLSRTTRSLSTKRVYHFRRQLFVLKGLLKQIQSTLNQCKESFWANHLTLLQDLKENIDLVYFRLDDISHNFDQLFSLYLSINEQRNNEVMKILTVFASIMLPLTFVASFYGMNFDYLPGLHSNIGLTIVSFLMVSISGVLIWYFKRKGWFMPQKD